MPAFGIFHTELTRNSPRQRRKLNCVSANSHGVQESARASLSYPCASERGLARRVAKLTATLI